MQTTTDPLQFFKALADETRLKIIGLVSEREYNVRELAEALELTEPTVSHHVLKLRELGLITLRTEGTSHFYQLNPDTLNRQLVDFITDYKMKPKPQQDTAWIDALEVEDWEREVLRTYTFDGRITRIPKKDKKWLVLLRWLATKFEAGAQYTELQVNETLKSFNEDYALLRRDLVDYGFMGREKNGSLYWRK